MVGWPCEELEGADTMSTVGQGGSRAWGAMRTIGGGQGRTGARGGNEKARWAEGAGVRIAPGLRGWCVAVGSGLGLAPGSQRCMS